jgi:hypothetical protein
MPELKRVDASCFEDVHALLLRFRNPRVTVEQWRSLLAPRWNADEGYAGYALTDGGRVVGFLGYVFSSREIAGRAQRFCNLSSWIVEPEHRADSLKLLLPALKLREHTVTNLTPRPTVAVILEKLGFQKLETGVRVVPPVPFGGGGDCEVTTDRQEIAKWLTGREAVLFRDHAELPCGHVLLREASASCYLVHTKRQYRGIGFTHVHHVSDAEVLARNIGRVRGLLARLNGTPVTMIDRRFLGATRVPWSFSKDYPAPLLYRSESVPAEAIDNLYSELVLLRV